jgi:hypothetical protein
LFEKVCSQRFSAVGKLRTNYEPNVSSVNSPQTLTKDKGQMTNDKRQTPGEMK